MTVDGWRPSVNYLAPAPAHGKAFSLITLNHTIRWYIIVLVPGCLGVMDDREMPKKSRTDHRGKLSYPKHVFKPEDLLHFIELRQFTEGWDELGLDDEADLAALQIAIMVGPKKHPVIPGTGGLRKMRFAPDHWNTGKRGAARVCYVYFQEYGIVLLVVAYGKNEKDDLTAAEKKTIAKLIIEVEKELDRIFIDGSIDR